MNNEVYILINTIDKVKEFVKDAESFSCDIDVVRGRYIVDARSILGILSMDLIKPLMVKIHSDDNQEIMRFLSTMSKYIY